MSCNNNSDCLPYGNNVNTSCINGTCSCNNISVYSVEGMCLSNTALPQCTLSGWVGCNCDINSSPTTCPGSPYSNLSCNPNVGYVCGLQATGVCSGRGQANFTCNSSIYSPNGNVHLDMQNDGNLVLYETPTNNVLWASHTWNVGTAPFKLVLQIDGNLVIYDATMKATWASGTSNNNNISNYFSLYVQNDGNLVIYDTNNVVKWASGSFSSYVMSDYIFASTIYSKNKHVHLDTQADGNLVLYVNLNGMGNVPVWSSGTSGAGPLYGIILGNKLKLLQFNKTYAEYTPYWSSTLYSNIPTNPIYLFIDESDYNFAWGSGSCKAYIKVFDQLNYYTYVSKTLTWNNISGYTVN